MGAEISLQREEANQLIQTVDARQFMELGKNLHTLLTIAGSSDWKQKRCVLFSVLSKKM